MQAPWRRARGGNAAARLPTRRRPTRSAGRPRRHGAGWLAGAPAWPLARFGRRRHPPGRHRGAPGRQRLAREASGGSRGCRIGGHGATFGGWAGDGAEQPRLGRVAAIVPMPSTPRRGRIDSVGGSVPKSFCKQARTLVSARAKRIARGWKRCVLAAARAHAIQQSDCAAPQDSQVLLRGPPPTLPFLPAGCVSPTLQRGVQRGAYGD